MSSVDELAVINVTRFAIAGDGVIIGVILAYVAIQRLIEYTTSSSALQRIRNAPSVRVSDLRSLISDSDGGDEKLVVVRGVVESKSAVIGNWKKLWPDYLVSSESSYRAVVIQRSQKCIYNTWKNIFGRYPDLKSILATALRQQGSTSTKSVPFVLVNYRQQTSLDCVAVDFNGSNHPLPLTTVCHHVHPIEASSYTFLQALFGHEYPVFLVDEEKVPPLGKEVLAVGVCSSKDGIPLIKSCSDLPYFLCELDKEQMITELSSRTQVLLWFGIGVEFLSVGVLGFAFVRNWKKWKQWREQRRQQINAEASVVRNITNNEESELLEDDETGDVPDGQLCVVCLMRRRRAAFIPCGHMVCCRRCSLCVECDLSPKCPVCRQEITNSFRIYDS